MVNAICLINNGLFVDVDSLYCTDPTSTKLSIVNYQLIPFIVEVFFL